jgi:hypothetical protein
MQLEADVHDTAASMFSVPLAGFAVVCSTQPVDADAGVAAATTPATAAVIAKAARRPAGARRRDVRVIVESFRWTTPPRRRRDRPGSCPAGFSSAAARLKWFYWHGNAFRALRTIDGLVVDPGITQHRLEQARLL